MIKQESQYNEILSKIKWICDYMTTMTEKLAITVSELDKA